jgi:hypothetical protein
VNLVGPQRAIERTLMPHALTAPATARRLVAQTSACGLRTTSQTIQRGGDRVYAVLVLTLPAATEIVLAPDEQVTVGGRVYAVIGPRVGNVTLSVKYDVYQVR